jgi:hypothetical protein
MASTKGNNTIKKCTATNADISSDQWFCFNKYAWETRWKSVFDYIGASTSFSYINEIHPNVRYFLQTFRNKADEVIGFETRMEHEHFHSAPINESTKFLHDRAPTILSKYSKPSKMFNFIDL